MYKQTIIQYLTSINRPYTIHGHEVSCQCLSPSHQDNTPSFNINTKTGLMYCFSCRYKNFIGNLVGDGVIDPEMERNSKYAQALRDLEDLETPEAFEETEGVLLPPRSSLTLQSFRGLSQDTIDSAGLYYCNRGRYSGRIIFPIKDVNGDTVGFDARITPLDNTPPRVAAAKYLRPSSFKTARIVGVYVGDPESHKVHIVEGIIDAISYMQMGYNAACNFGLLACSPEKAGMLLSYGFDTVINGFDNDSAGMIGFQKVKESFRQYFTIGRPTDIVTKIREAGCGDANEYLQQLKEIHEENYDNN